MVLPEIKEKIGALKAERKAVILAHNYQTEEIQELADYTGDSFDLSRIAAEVDAEVIVFCGVHFMAESAAILAPGKLVLLPEAAAGCPMADMVTPEALRRYKEQYPGAAVVVYINSSAAVKAESDICATSANAAAVINSLEAGRVIFAPDRNLAHFVSRHTAKEIIPWPGYCITHHRITPGDIARARRVHPGALVIVHPECRPEVAEMADAVLGTSGMIRFVKETDAAEIIVGTEAGLIHRLRKERPDLKYYVPTPGLICPNMKYTTPDKVLSALEKMQHRVAVTPEIRERAAEALRRMLAVPSS
ncbi:MAG TPA: quinolinate synthase NadA [Bacillota bacterium]|nr:quinolinate synthase NadA [Bacillota bacterium]HOJ83492.1 quinolinate synthase NadA [Bacillota bacterium]HOL14830.1 quinolinate synthase NadA [Bacillota bacterium]HPZ11280.1 quinolinate synthase NadA [Bacillota bacterium]HQE09421.1 quinolinate synthase NadA [Bacillota bacterium]